MRTCFIAAAVVLASLLSGDVRAVAPQDNASEARPVRERRGRLTPEMIKKFDQNGDGELDLTERQNARRAQRDESTNTTTAPAEPKTGKKSTGQKPLTEMSASERSRGEEGGLYGEGRNTPPAPHLAAALEESKKIEPLDAAGRPAADGKIVLISIGMSNTTREFSAFKTTADADARKSQNVVIVDGAQGGQAGAEWCDPENRKTWDRLDQRLASAGATPDQVQVAWIKQAVKRPPADSLESARELQTYLASIVVEARRRFPNLRIAYLSSRTYGGFSDRHGEPDSFDTALAVRGLIHDQVAGDAVLNYDARRGRVAAPLLLWGPYLWGRRRDAARRRPHLVAQRLRRRRHAPFAFGAKEGRGPVAELLYLRPDGRRLVRRQPRRSRRRITRRTENAAGPA